MNTLYIIAALIFSLSLVCIVVLKIKMAYVTRGCRSYTHQWSYGTQEAYEPTAREPWVCSKVQYAQSQLIWNQAMREYEKECVRQDALWNNACRRAY